MTDKERLEEIIAVVKSQTEAVRKLSHNDLNWLIEQAERVQDLEKENQLLYGKLNNIQDEINRKIGGIF